MAEECILSESPSNLSYAAHHVRIMVLDEMVEPMGFESTSDMETKEFGGPPWPSKELKGMKGNSY